MKNIWIIFLFLAIILFFSGCVKEPTKLSNNKTPSGCAYNNPSCDDNQSLYTNNTYLNENVQSNLPKKFLTLIAVTEAGGSEYNSSNGWARVLKNRETDNIQIFDVVLWDNGSTGNPNIISVYKFDRTFDPFKTDYIDGGQAWIDYLESFNIMIVNVPSACSSAQGALYYECSNAYLDAFKRIMKVIVQNQPAEHYGIKYLGHGSGDGSIFAGKITQPDSESLFSYVNSLIGKKLDFLDWGYNCTMGTYQVVSSQYRYANYIISSDLLRGGFVADWANDYYRLKPEGIYDGFFSPSKTIRQSLIEMLDSERMFWETPTVQNDMISKQLKQALSIYDSSKFEDLMIRTKLDQSMQSGDAVLDYIRTNYPAEEQKFYDFRFHYISNKDFFSWDLNSNGFKKN